MHWHNLVMVVCARIKLLYLSPNQPTNGRQISLSCQVNTWLVPQATWIIKLMLCGETERICRKLSHFWRFEQSRYIIIRESAHNNPVRLSALGRAIRVVVRLPNPLPGDLWMSGWESVYKSSSLIIKHFNFQFWIMDATFILCPSPSENASC